jgi:phage gpG-like protein
MANYKFTDNSAAVLKAFETKKRQALDACGAHGERCAKSKTPVKTGRLRDSIAHAPGKDAEYIGTNVEYAPYVEMGSIHNKHPAHMLKRAITEHISEYKAIIEAAFR